MVFLARIITIILFIISSIIALFLTNALQIFNFILMFGAGTGLIFILRWFWFRINAWSEISAMFFSGLFSILLNLESISTYYFGNEGVFESYLKYPIIVFSTTIFWVIVTLITNPVEKKKINNFKKIISHQIKDHNLKKYLINSFPNIFLSVTLVLSILIFVGSIFNKNQQLSIICFALIIVSTHYLLRNMKINN